MSLGTTLAEQVTQLAGADAPLSVTVSAHGRSANAILLQWSPLAVSVQEVCVRGGAASGDLAQRADELAARLTYLAEPIRLLEIDRSAREAQLRSAPPKQIEQGVEYFEVRFSHAGAISFRRYRHLGGESRTEIPAAMTFETLIRVVDDLAAA